MGKNHPIGIFDSGVGGLTVVKALMEKLPGESFIYFGDTAHLPYGNKNESQLLGYAHSIIQFLLTRQVKAIVVACGTHSSVTLSAIAREYPLPFLGVVKAGARSAARTTRNGKIGVAATQATVSSRAYTREIQSLHPHLEVFETACPRLVPLIESGELDSPRVREAVAEYLEPLVNEGIDSLVLGCTHYPFVAAAITDYLGPEVSLVDPSCETVVDLAILLREQSLENDQQAAPAREFYVSGNDESFYKVGTLLIGDVIKEVERIRFD